MSKIQKQSETSFSSSLLHSILTKSVACLFVVSIVSGCSSTPNVFTSQDEVSWDELYLRGVFTWWEAEEQYKVNEVEEDLYRVSVDLVADGQPYDFKFADVHWTPGLRCGYANKQLDETLMLGKKVKANCDTQVNNFKFTPGQSGKFHFFLDVRSEEHPTVFIVAANSGNEKTL